MTNKEWLLDNGYEDSVIFENPCFDDAIVGVTPEGRVVYNYSLMVKSAMEEEDWTEQEATDWIEFNTIRSLAYVEYGPIIMYGTNE